MSSTLSFVAMVIQSNENVDPEVEIYNLWRVRKTIMQLCADGGYIVSNNELNQTLDEFKAEFGYKEDVSLSSREQLKVQVYHVENPIEQMIVWFPDGLKIGIKNIRDYLKFMQNEMIYRGIIVVQKDITHSAKKALQAMAPKYFLQLFMEHELLTNITKHELVPEHVVLTKEEKTELLSRYKLKESQLMRIQANDPVARYYGLKRGQVVKIIRSSESAGKYVTYRFVV